jgi:hydroxymethylbilane synthase
MINSIRIGTRGSQLALYQAEQVKLCLTGNFPQYNFEIVVIHTKGDKILDVALSKIGDKGLFTKEIETALLNNEIDLAVHSLKDLPTALPSGLTLGGVLQRGQVLDALISKDGKKITELTSVDTVGTSSLRRISQLLHLNKEIQIKDIRGNVNSRLNKMENGYCDALLLAGAGLIRLGLKDKITQLIDPDLMLPAVSQGIIGIEIRENDNYINDFIKAITHPETYISALAERTFLRKLEGGCQVPLGCYSSINNDEFSMTGFVADLKGEKLIRRHLSGPLEKANETAAELAKILLENGGAEILNDIRKSLPGA